MLLQIISLALSGTTVLLIILFMLIQALRNKYDTQQFTQQFFMMQERLQQLEQQRNQIDALLKTQQQEQNEQRQRFDQHQIQSLKLIQESLHQAMAEIRAQVTSSLKFNSEELGKRIDHLTAETQLKLKEISGQVDKQLSAGFEKTTSTFNDVMQRLTIIDEAQKKITELSTNVVGLQEILQDKRSRGAFGEVQLMNLIQNLIPPKHFEAQHTLSNGKRVDCILFLPDPTGNIAIDAKFPLETYRLLCDENLSKSERKPIETQFRQDISKHIQDIADRYIIPGETADGAILFIPAEAIFAEIHAHYSDLVDFAHQKRVWLASPTTLMAILTTARAVLKDAATRKQVHVIQQHLIALSKDFERFQKNMDQLSKHIQQANHDVELVHKSSRKITGRFNKIEKVELQHEPTNEASVTEMTITESSDITPL